VVSLSRATSIIKSGVFHFDLMNLCVVVIPCLLLEPWKCVPWTEVGVLTCIAPG
jgi:hypothetical protein